MVGRPCGMKNCFAVGEKSLTVFGSVTRCLYAWDPALGPKPRIFSAILSTGMEPGM